MLSRIRSKPLRISVVYTAAGVAWVFFNSSPFYRGLIGLDYDPHIFQTMSRVGYFVVTGAALYLVLSWYDRETDRYLKKVQQANKALERANRHLEQYAYAAAHDLQEPLRNIKLFAQILMRNLPDLAANAAAETAVGYITDGTDRMERLVRDLLMFSERLDAPIDGKLYSSEPAMREATEMLHHQIQESQAEISWSLDDTPIPPPRLRQILTNLIGNSIKYRHPDRTPVIHIDSHRIGDIGFHMCVRDNGMGISQEYFTKIFGVFKRLHGQEIPGTGIGLALCKRIVEHYGGRIWVESEFGSGSVFHIVIPTHTAHNGHSLKSFWDALPESIRPPCGEDEEL